MTGAIALVGPDGTGKSSICQIVRDTLEIEVVDIPDLELVSSLPLREVSQKFRSISMVGDNIDNALGRLVSASLGYAPLLALSAMALERAKKISPHGYLVARHPYFDVPAYLEHYVGTTFLNGLARYVADSALRMFESPEDVIYLKSDIRTCMDRLESLGRQLQSHENPADLGLIIDRYDELVFNYQSTRPENTYIIDTKEMSLEEVTLRVVQISGSILGRDGTDR